MVNTWVNNFSVIFYRHVKNKILQFKAKRSNKVLWFSKQM